jgi:MFS transporter, ACS family, glucarate transporter
VGAALAAPFVHRAGFRAGGHPLELNGAPMSMRPTRARRTMLGFALGAMAVAYLDRVCISTAAPAMKAELGLDDAQMGYVFSAFTLAYALFEVPSGWLADRFGARVTLTRIVLWWSAMTAATGAARGFASLVAVRLLFGMGEAGVLPSLARAFGRWLPARERGRAFGLTIMAAALGGAVTQPVVVAILGRVSWRIAFPLFGSVGIVYAVAWFLWFRDDPRDHAGVNAAELAEIGCDAPSAHPRVPWRAFLRSRTLVALAAMYFGSIYGWYFYLTWLPTYLMRGRGFELAAVGWLAAAPLLGIATGSLAGGWLADALTRRFGPRIGLRASGLVGLPLAALAIVAAVWAHDPRASAYCLAAAAGLAALGVASAWSVCVVIGGRHAGVVSGAMNTFGNLGGVASPIVVGLCLTWWSSWNAPLYTVAGMYVFAAFCWLGVDPTEPLDLEA